MGKITTVGVDLAKNIFHLHAVDDRGKVVLQREQGAQGQGANHPQ